MQLPKVTYVEKGSHPVAYVKGAAAEEGRGENPSGRANKICPTVADAESYGLIVISLMIPVGTYRISCVDTADRLGSRVFFFILHFQPDIVTIRGL